MQKNIFEKIVMFGAPLTVLALLTVVVTQFQDARLVRRSTASIVDAGGTSLVLHYPFDSYTSGVTTLQDSSGNGITASFLGTLPTSIAGNVGSGALSMKSGGFLRANSSLGITSYPFTISAWVRQPSSVKGLTPIAGFYDTTTGTDMKGISINNSGKAGIFFSNTEGYEGTSPWLRNNAWHHIVGIFTSTGISLYVDGTSVANLPSQFTFPTTLQKFTVSGFDRYAADIVDYPYTGDIDDVRVYKTALTADDVQALFSLGQYTGGGTGGPDTQAPTISITSPTTGSSPTGSVTLTAQATDNEGVAGVQFYINGEKYGQEILSAPYSVSWNTTTVSNGTYTITAVAKDYSDNTTTSSAVSVSVTNPVIAPKPHKVISWNAPIGIPEPSFGIREDVSHFILRSGETCATQPQKCFDYGNGQQAYKLNSVGEPYTHYVEPTNPNSTDSDNPFGSPAKPRVTLPTLFTPGMIVELHGTYNKARVPVHYYTSGGGTKERPAFIRGLDTNGQKAVFADLNFEIASSYLIVENIEFRNTAPRFYPWAPGLSIHHNALRYCDLHTGTVAASYTPGITVSNIVIFANNIQTDKNVFDYDAPGEIYENDINGVYIGRQSEDVWVLDNTIHDLPGDSVGGGHDADYTAKRYYIGRNDLYRTGENAIDIKEVDTVIVSQNKMHDFKGGSEGSDGTATVVHYGPTYSPKNVWFLFNEIYNASDTGFQVGGDQLFDVRFIGNIVRNIHNSSGNAWGYRAWNSNDVYLVNNLFYDVDNGIYSDTGDGSKLTVENNIIAKVKDGGYHVSLAGSSHMNLSQFANNIFYQPGGNARIAWGGVNIINLTLYGSLLNVGQFMSSTGKCVGCLEADPKFNNSAQNDFSLRQDSPAINAGSSAVIDRLAALYPIPGISIKKDISGGTRPASGVWDIGPHEYLGTIDSTQKNLTVVLGGQGQGSVTVTASGSVLQTAESSAASSYTVSGVVTLTAVPEPGSTFGGWQGASCTGTTCVISLVSDLSVVALFNANQGSGPAIISPSVTVGAGRATIYWTTDVAATGQVQYGLTTSYGNVSPQSTAKTVHSHTLTGLNRLTTYHYRIVVTSADGTTQSADAVFTTPNSPPPPVVGAPFVPGNGTTTPPVVITPSSTPVVSPFTRNLQLGAQEPQVAVLQDVLVKEKVLDAGAFKKGIFDTKTEKAVQAFQKKYDIVRSGKPQTTGYGSTDAKTRSILNEIASQQAQTNAIVQSIPRTFTFTRSLQIGSVGEDVRYLQIFLNTHNFPVAKSGAGSRGREGTVYGTATAQALAKFQELYKDEILTPMGKKKGDGVFGKTTLAKVNALRAAGK